LISQPLIINNCVRVKKRKSVRILFFMFNVSVNWHGIAANVQGLAKFGDLKIVRP
jgi:hypothetical protein